MKSWKWTFALLLPGMLLAAGMGTVGADESKALLATYESKRAAVEKNDVAAEHPEVVKRLTEALEKFTKEIKQNARPVGKLPPDSPYKPDEKGVYHIPK